MRSFLFLYVVVLHASGAGNVDAFPTYRQCTVHIMNQLKSYTLSNPGLYMDSGYCQVGMPLVIPSMRSDIALFAKTAYTARGAVGVFTYDLRNEFSKQNDKKIAVMFLVPYDFNIYSNWYAVGVFDVGKPCDRGMFKKMYKEEQHNFVRGQANGHSLTYTSDDVTIKASMSDTFTPVLKVEVCDEC